MIRPTVLVASLALALVACGSKEAPPAPSATPKPAPPPVTASAAPPKPAATTAPSVAAPSAPSATASAASSASAPPGKPTEEEWRTGAEVRVTGSTAAGCDTKRVREWLRISCGKPNATGGTPDRLVVQKAEIIAKGGPIVQIRKELVLREEGAPLVLETRFVEGVDVEADVFWSDGKNHLSIFWPSGKPEPQYLGAFK